jgi:plastocyanin
VTPTRAVSVALALALLVGLARADDAPKTGTIRGVVKLERKFERPAPIFVTKDKHACGETIEQDRAVVSEKGEIANVVVALARKDVPAGPYADFPPKAPVVVDQKGCRYVPRVTVSAVEQPVRFTNSDPVTHTLQARSKVLADAWDPAIEANGAAEKTFERADRWSLGCSIHPFMRNGGVLVVSAHPWTALTGKDGAFVLEKVPAGRYHVVLWHEALEDEALEKQGVEVTVEPGKTAELSVAFK